MICANFNGCNMYVFFLQILEEKNQVLKERLQMQVREQKSRHIK